MTNINGVMTSMVSKIRKAVSTVTNNGEWYGDKDDRIDDLSECSDDSSFSTRHAQQGVTAGRYSR